MEIKEHERTEPRRAIGRCGTTARLLVGGFMMGSVGIGSFTGNGEFEPAAWLLGLVGFPVAVLGWQAWRTHRTSERIMALTGPLGHLVTLVAFLVLYGTTWYAPPTDFVSDAALLFFGSSMLLAAVRGYAGCEVLSISNWLLGRDDQVGCAVFDPIDSLEHDRR
jgi:hypothetical protein